MAGGRLWKRMNAEVRRDPAALRRADLPIDPGVYAWYRRGRAVYVGKGDSLAVRLSCHLSKGRSLANSAFRRNVAQHLGIASARAIYLGEYVPTDDDLRRIRIFVESCRVAFDFLMFASVVRYIRAKYQRVDRRTADVRLEAELGRAERAPTGPRRILARLLPAPIGARRSNWKTGRHGKISSTFDLAASLLPASYVVAPQTPEKRSRRLWFRPFPGLR